MGGNLPGKPSISPEISQSTTAPRMPHYRNLPAAVGIVGETATAFKRGGEREIPPASNDAVVMSVAMKNTEIF